MIIDANTHITTDGRWFNLPYDASVERLIGEMEKGGIYKSILVPFDGIIPNDYVKKIEQLYPDKFIAAASFNPHKFSSPEEAAKGFIDEFDRSSFKIIKFHNRLHKYSPLSNFFLETLKANNSASSPKIIYICGYFHTKGIEVPQSPPEIAFYLANTYPNTKFVFLHACGSWALQTAQAIRELPNAFIDLSLTVSKYRKSSLDYDLHYLFNVFDKRILWGSDFPEFSPLKALDDFYEIAGDLDKQKMENILGLNLHSLLFNP